MIVPHWKCTSNDFLSSLFGEPTSCSYNDSYGDVLELISAEDLARSFCC
ncbi:unnamed protein product [Haemonchus placei]|uniref:Uncharacterized protein n=1 Tax=Haemonchus placei TaxID=6290 RepID=A0A0N4WH09_HAEPC|nr:unnamed protein product [Haemonchus placei]